ncbi:hypothetical protein, partial [Streptantibioticus rubrisoli]
MGKRGWPDSFRAGSVREAVCEIAYGAFGTASSPVRTPGRAVARPAYRLCRIRRLCEGRAAPRVWGVRCARVRGAPVRGGVARGARVWGAPVWGEVWRVRRARVRRARCAWVRRGGPCGA